MKSLKNSGMYGGYCSVLVTGFLLLVAVSFAPAARSSASTDSCVDQSGIICSSLHLHGSLYYHKLDTDITTNENQLDMIHCELNSQRYKLHLDHEDGIKSLISSGACIISDGINCTRVILYVNLTYYDQRNGSIIPVCAIRSSDYNSECFCIHYLTLESTPDSCDTCTERCKPVIIESVTTTKPEPNIDHQTQPRPTDGCPAAMTAMTIGATTTHTDREEPSNANSVVAALVVLTGLLSVTLVLVITGWVWTCWTMKKKKKESQLCKNCQEQESEEEQFCLNQTHTQTITQPVVGTAIELLLNSLEESGQNNNRLSSKDNKGHHDVNRVENLYTSSEGSTNSSLQQEQAVNRVEEGESGEKHVYHVLENPGSDDYEDPDKNLENTATEYETPLPLKELGLKHASIHIR